MFFTCDVYLTTADGRYFERVLYIRADNYGDAARFAEQRACQMFPDSSEISEVNLQLISGDPDLNASEAAISAGVYREYDPVELVPVRKRWWWFN